MNDTKTSGAVARVLRISLLAVNAYLVQGARGAVLVDTGFPGATDNILKKLSERGVDPEEISLIVLTHGHPDHAGSAAELRKRLRVPVAIHALEAGWMRSGISEIPRPIRAFGRLIKPLLRPEIPAFEPDILLEEVTSLKEYGLEGEILHTPGHSPGSISLLLPGGAIVGDLMAGGFVLENYPNYPFLAESVPQLHGSIRELMAHAPARLFFGHGQPSGSEPVWRRFAEDNGFG